MNSVNIRNIISSFAILDVNDKIYVALLLVLSLVNSLVQTIGIVSIMPFITIISDPSIIDSNQYIGMIKDRLGVESYQSLLMVFGGFTFFSLAASNFFSIFTYWVNLRFFNNKEQQLTKELLDNFLSKKTTAFNRVKKSQILKYILSDVDRVLIGTQLTIIELISDIFVCTIVIALLLYMDVRITIITTLALGVTYILIFVVLSGKIKNYGESFASLESKVYQSIKHAIDMFREIRVSGKKEFFVKEFSTPSKALADHAVKYYVLSFLPVQLVEILVFGIIIVVSVYYSISDESSVNTIAAISIFAFATYRLLPILKSIFDGFEELIYNSSMLQQLIDQYMNKEADPAQINEHIKTTDSLIVKDSISLECVTFKYAADLPLVLSGFNLLIPQGKFTCLSGKSGAGKSTILDILLGLVTPSTGKFCIDGMVIKVGDIRRWQNNIGYVPQKIQFVDGTVYQNIAFGVNNNDVDIERVKTVAKLAAIDELIELHLPDQYDSVLGDGGVILSGGEKQRIGIARSLYHDPQVLIFDEATNELDPETESMILKNIQAMNNKTIIFVTHKPAVIEIADNHVEISRLRDKLPR